MPIIVIARQSENGQLKCSKRGAGCFFIASISILLFFLSIAHAFLQAKSSLHSKQKYRFMRILYKLLYKKYILKIHHEKRLACATFW